jgi:hypothetical protein
VGAGSGAGEGLAWATDDGVAALCSEGREAGSSPPLSLANANAPAPKRATPPSSRGSLLPLRRRDGGYVSSTGEVENGDEATATGAADAVGALRWAGSVCVTRARSARSFSAWAFWLSARAASLMTTAGVDGSSLGT